MQELSSSDEDEEAKHNHNFIGESDTPSLHPILRPEEQADREEEP
jgi:hypothetical protein